jgi:hypothetical protein
MPNSKRITANLPSDLLRDAMEVTGKGITETIVEGLQRVALRGKIHLDVDLDTSRERNRR